MYEQGYSKYIKSCVERMDYNHPIFTKNVAQELTDHFNLNLPYAKRIVNQNMKRLADRELIVHFAKGIYYRPIKTAFGKSVLNKDDVFYNALTVEDGKIIGYESCPSILNTLGLCTLLTAEKNIVTNRYRKILPKEVNIKPAKPRRVVNGENYRYLQAIDIICGMWEYPVDAENPHQIINRYMTDFHIDPLKLIAYAKHYESEKIFNRTVDFLTEGLV